MINFSGLGELFNKKTEVISSSKPKPIKIKVEKNSLLTNKLRRIISNPSSYSNSDFIIYDTILPFLDYYINIKVVKEGKLNPQKVQNVITTKENLVIRFTNDIQIVCWFEPNFTKRFFTVNQGERKFEWLITDDDGIHYEYDLINVLLDLDSYEKRNKGNVNKR
jgi:hypothetical protein